MMGEVVMAKDIKSKLTGEEGRLEAKYLLQVVTVVLPAASRLASLMNMSSWL